MESQPSQEVTELLRQWEEEHSTQGYDPIPTLTRLSEIIETETENFMKKDPDPFDERHPSRSDPNCALGHALKVMFKKDNFMTKLVNDYVRETYYTRMYITRDVRELNIAACRLTLDLMPGLEMSVVFQDNEVLIQRLYTWAENSMEPLQSYATGLLAAAMEVSDIAVNYREQNGRLIPIMLQRLHTLKKKPIENQVPAKTPPQTRHFARFGKRLDSDHLYSPTPRKKGRYKEGGGEPDAVTEKRKSIDENSKLAQNSEPTNHESTPTKIYEIDSSPSRDLVMSPPPRPPPITLSAVHASNDIGSDNASVPIIIAESSNSSWAEMESHVIGSMQIHPLSDASKQMLILRYLTPLGEYQEFLSYVFEHGALDLILGYINMKESRDSRLAFEALKYLSSLLCHKKFSLEFINLNGLQKFLEVPRPSVAATGVSICLYYLAYCEDAMERVCQLPSTILADLVRFALWLLECSHDSGRCHATMFFGLSFQFPVILEEFDHQDGLRKLYNVISTLPILSEDTVSELTDDESCAARQIVRHVSVALKRYLEAHLRFKVVQLHRQGNLYTEQSLEAAILSNPPYKAIKRTPEQIQEHIEDLQKSEFSRWPPVDQLVRLGGVSMLLQIIAFTYDWNFNGRAETVRCALDVISVCSVLPKVQMLLCDKVEMPDEEVTTGVNIILSAAEGEIVADAEVQKAALNVLVNCVCTPYRGRGYTLINPLKKKFAYKYDDVIQKIWESVRRNNGIMMLLQLMLVKSPITDADSIRGLACQALAGLARCTTVTQIISKLPLFTTGQIQSLMHDPILQEKRHEHVMFQKYALELMERVSGKSKHMAHIETSLANIHRANVVAQTRIRYNEEQLLVLIYRHLQSRGYKQAATTLKETAQLNSPDEPEPIIHHPHHQLYDEYCRPRTLGRSLMSAMNACTPNSTHSHSATNQMTLRDSGIANSTTTATTPNVIKLRRIQQQSSLPMVSPLSASSGALTPRSLQKPWRGAAGAPPPPAALAAARRPAHRITLDSIVTEYLTNQHSLCRNPIATCPQFNLFEPHKCSEGREDSRSGVSSRIFSREYDAFKLARGQHIPKLVHSRFSNVRTLRPADLDSYFTTCVFHPHQQTVLAATSTGEIKVFSNTTNTQDDTTYTILENTYIYHMEISRDGKMLLISTNNVWRPFSAVVDTDRFLVPFNFEGEEYAEFGKKNQDKVICTKGEVASIYDITTQRKLVNLKPNISNQYTKNRATFSPDDHLVLSDGVLWDVKAGKEIHKLDKLNQSLSGVFHPNGLEVISNAEVWDLRTFHLLKTVPSLDKAEVIFPHNCTCLYSVGMEQETDDKTQYDTSFRTLDPYHYTNIATIDVKKDIYSLAVNRFDTQIALVENCGIFDSIQESVIKIYDVGRRRDLEDEADEEEDDDITGTEENEEDDGSDSASENGDLQMQLLRDVVELGFNNDLINLDEDADHDGDHEDNEDNDANPNDGGGSDGHEQSDDTDPASESDSDAGDAALASVRYNRRAAPRGARSLPRRAAARRALRRRGRQPAQPPSSAGDDFALAEELANDLAALDGDRTSDNDSLQERDAS